ncbi:hypothetical protein BDY17DRAFT_327578 [Neohortaea acidophila]|uniref:Cytochrome b mRNA-processing protein 4 n=1 Tax=Neohortaea acidophila TaxID=245834 RepID=A0A6A6PHY7_9PEZI|nr:uncharacterized protein BDY17DRAFT_327578 [Neohortaea acidophila]KAF2479630.1 hypothetical protein BDY17DRAFT_327578 [Neohortaea acidophila]
MPPITGKVWALMGISGAAMCIGGPALIYYVMPTEEQLFLRYNPELQRRSLERRQEKQEEFDHFVNKLKEYSKSDKPIWYEIEQQAARQKKQAVQAELDRRKAAEAEAEAMREEIKKSLK